jgi:hypothetical protein
VTASPLLTVLETGSQKRRADSRVFLARLLLTLDDGKTAAAERSDAIGPLDQWVASGPLDQWVASDHDALLAA